MIPDEAVEAAARAIYSVSRSVLNPASEFTDEWATWEQAHERKREQDRLEARAAIEAAVPFMHPIPRTYSLEEVAAEFGIDLDELRKEAGAG